MIDLQQGSQEWLEFRRTRIGASDAPIIIGVSPWKTPLQLWEEKLGLKEGVMNNAMYLGLQLEDTARAQFEELVGYKMKPAIRIHPEYPWMISSLDGIREDGGEILEIKCPGEKTHSIAVSGKIPEYYIPQLQHQMAVCGLDHVQYVSYYNGDMKVLTEKRNDLMIKEIIEKEKSFLHCMNTFTMPELTNKDFVHVDDPNWDYAASRLKYLMGQKEIIDSEIETMKNSLIEISKGMSCKNNLLKLRKCFRKGAVDYSKIPELKDLNLDPYRKPSTTYYRFDII